MNFDKRSMRRIFLLIVGGIVFGWLILDTERATTMLDGIWALFSPFVAGAAIAFIFNVPMRSIERRLGDIRRIGVRRGLSISTTSSLEVRSTKGGMLSARDAQVS